MIKTVMFDLGGVIVPLDFSRAFAALQRECPYAAEEIPEKIGSSGLIEPFEMGQMEPEEFFRRMRGVLRMNDIDFPRFCDVWSSIFPPHTLVPESLLEALRGRYRLLLLSNTNAIHFPMIRKNYPLLRHFDDYVLSYQVGALKPSPRIYQEAVARAACPPGECFFTDDVLANVEAARDQGIDAVQFTSCAQLQEELRARGVEF